MQDYKFYNIWECPTCTHFKAHPVPPLKRKEIDGKRVKGSCKIEREEIPLVGDPRYGLHLAPPTCGNHQQGRPRKD